MKVRDSEGYKRLVRLIEEEIDWLEDTNFDKHAEKLRSQLHYIDLDAAIEEL